MIGVALIFIGILILAFIILITRSKSPSNTLDSQEIWTSQLNSNVEMSPWLQSKTTSTNKTKIDEIKEHSNESRINTSPESFIDLQTINKRAIAVFQRHLDRISEQDPDIVQRLRHYNKELEGYIQTAMTKMMLSLNDGQRHSIAFSMGEYFVSITTFPYVDNYLIMSQYPGGYSLFLMKVVMGEEHQLQLKYGCKIWIHIQFCFDKIRDLMSVHFTHAAYPEYAQGTPLLLPTDLLGPEERRAMGV